jgi:2-deoxy-D-gluconate 3-dehydrogenase
VTEGSGPFGPFTLDGKRAVVTGAAMGIGRGIASRFVEAGADVVLVDLDSHAVEAAADGLRGGRGKVEWLALDIARDDAEAVIVAKAVSAFGGLDILVNNAGIYPQVPLLEMPIELLDRVLAVNLRSLVLISREAAKQMVDQGGGGAILNIASIDSLHPSMVGLAAYDTSKGGVWMFTKSLALELAPHGIRVNAIAPGGITTEGTKKPLAGSGMTEAEQRAVIEEFAKRVPMGRMGEPDEIALASVFLVSDAASYVTGSLLVVDGGALLS